MSSIYDNITLEHLQNGDYGDCIVVFYAVKEGCRNRVKYRKQGLGGIYHFSLLEEDFENIVSLWEKVNNQVYKPSFIRNWEKRKGWFSENGKPEFIRYQNLIDLISFLHLVIPFLDDKSQRLIKELLLFVKTTIENELILKISSENK